MEVPYYIRRMMVPGFESERYLQGSQHTCSSSIERLKRGPANFEWIIDEYSDKGLEYTDMEFVGRDMLYWKGYDKEFQYDPNYYETGIELGRLRFLRASEVFKDSGVTLWGNNTHSWLDSVQGETNNCYLISVLGSMAERPELI